jgi:uncharacterized protein involved in outer membrane biogenesis
LMAVLPFLFKDKIKAAVDNEINKNINATVNYEFGGLSLFSNFPNITVSLDQIRLVGKAQEFQGDTLFAADKFKLELDIMSVFGDEINIKGIFLKNSKIVTKYAKNGAFSWDITFPDTVSTPEPTDTTPSAPMKIKINHWELENAHIIYDDKTSPMYVEIKNLDHKGSGNIMDEVYDIKTMTTTPHFFLSYDNTTYFNDYTMKAKMDMNIDMAKAVYTFLENEVTLNNFTMGFEGKVAMPADDIDMDIKYSAKQTEFKNLLSLIPAVFMEGYDDLNAGGTIGFDGFVKGTYSETKMPGYGVNLVIKDGTMQYPDLPSSVKNIQMAMKVLNQSGETNDIEVNISKFHMDLGPNPIDATLLMKGLEPMNLDAMVAAKVNLAEITKIYPVDSTELKGIFSAQVKAKGQYSDSLKLMPVVDAKLGLTDGYVKTNTFPAPLENIQMSMSANSDGTMGNTTIALQYFKWLLDKEPFEMNALVKNLDDPNYNVTLKGLIDLAKMTKLYPLEGTTLSGRINANLQTEGIMSDVNAGNYAHTKSSGTMEISDMKYVSTDLPQGMTISSSKMSLSPDKFNLETYVGTLGRSDLSMDGYIGNYMGYLFGKKDTVLHGKLNMRSKTFDVNEWMEEEEATTATAAPAAEDTAALAPIEVPADIDFVINAAMDKLLYDNLVLSPFAGSIIVRNSAVRMDQVKFNTLGGSFITNGTYDAKNIDKPLFDFDLDIKNLSIQEAYKAFGTMQKMAPSAENITGVMNTKLVLRGPLDKEMMPVYDALNGSGTLNIPNATMKGGKVMGSVAQYTKMQGLDPMQLNNVNVQFVITDGKLELTKPIDVNAGNTKMQITGGHRLTGDLDYNMKMTIPAGAIGSATNNAIAQLSGTAPATNQSLDLTFKITGPASNPKVKPTGVGGQSVKDQTQDVVKDQVDKQVDDVKDQANQELEKQKQEAERQKQEAERKAKEEADRQKAEAEKKAKQELEKQKKDALKKIGF